MDAIYGAGAEPVRTVRPVRCFVTPVTGRAGPLRGNYRNTEVRTEVQITYI